MHGELCPGAIRGRLIVSDTIGWQSGGIIATGIARWTSGFPDDRCWHYLLLSYLVVPVVNVMACPLLPESPRWLLRKGREDQAAKVLHWLYGCREGYDADMELHLMKKSLDESKSDAKGQWKDLWKGTNKVKFASEICPASSKT